MDMYTLLLLRWVRNKEAIDSTENSARGYTAAWMGVELEREWIYVCIWLSSFTIYLKLSQHYFIPIQKSSDSQKFKKISCPLNAYVDNAVISIFGS